MDDEAYYLSQIPKPEPTRIGAKKISTVLNRVIQQKGYAAVQSGDLLRDAWAEAVGAELAGQSRVGKVERGALQIFVSNQVLMTELEFLKPTALRKLQSRLPEFSIRSLRIRVQHK